MAAVLQGMPIKTLPEPGELDANDQIIVYREDDGKAYRVSAGDFSKASETNISDAFSATQSYSAGDYCIYEDTLYKFLSDKAAGVGFNESDVQQTTVGDELSNMLIVDKTEDLYLGDVLTAGNYYSYKPDISKEGYTPIAVVGWYCNSRYVNAYRAMVNGDKLDASLYHSGSSSLGSTIYMYFNILYKKKNEFYILGEIYYGRTFKRNTN